MIIRQANKFDLPDIIEMLKHFREQTPIDIMRDCDDEKYINSLFAMILAGGGICLLAETDRPIGLIMGVIDQNVWDPKLFVLKELVYWVEPEHRNTTAGYRLLSNYNKAAKELVENDRIKMYTMTKMINSPDIDYGRFGYRKTEETWVAGA